MQNGSAGQEVVELAALAGLVLDPWQSYVIEESLHTRVGGKWACRDVCLICSRQNGKGSILEARELGGLFLLGEMELIHTAHQFKTAADHFKRIRGLIEGTPDLKAALAPRGIRASHGEESITLRSGARLRFVARSINGSGRGFTKIDLLAIDEAYQAGSGALSSLLPTQLAALNAQTWYTSSVVDKGEDSAALIRLRDRGRASSSRQLGYFEFSAAPDADPDDPVARAQGNPGLGLRFAHSDLQSYRETMSEDDFRAEFLSQWPDLGSNQVIDLAQWARTIDDDSSPTEIAAFGVAVSIDRRTAAIGMAGPRADLDWHVEVPAHLPGTEWVLDACAALDANHGPSVFVVDGGGPAASLIEPLRQRGLTVVVTTTSDVGKASAGFVDAVSQGIVWHRPQPVLDDAVAGAKRRDIGDGAFAFGRKNSDVDIVALEAVNLPLWAAMDGTNRNMHPINNVW